MQVSVLMCVRLQVHIYKCLSAAMIGRNNGFVGEVKERNTNVIFTHCSLHREALVSEILPADLVPAFNGVVSMISFVEMRPMKGSSFALLSEETGAERATLVLSGVVLIWQSAGRVQESPSR